MDEPLIIASGLRKEFPMGEVTVQALVDVDMAIQPRSFCLVMGPSGSGKSTLLHLIGGLDRPTGGRLHVDGQALESLDEIALARYRRNRVGFVFQSFNLIANMTALENVAFPMRFNRVPARRRRDRALEMLHRVALTDRAYHKPTEMSGGEQQRVAIARALVNDPTLILADEPTGNLDTASGDSVMEILAGLHQAGATVVVVTHDPRMTRYASHLVQILDGRVTAQKHLNAMPSSAPHIGLQAPILEETNGQ